MSHLRAFFCREYRDYALFGVEFLAEICQKFSEILRILAEILRKKLATGASGQYQSLFDCTLFPTETVSPAIYIHVDDLSIKVSLMKGEVY